MSLMYHLPAFCFICLFLLFLIVLQFEALGRSWQRSLACFEGLPSKLRNTVVTVNPALNVFSYDSDDSHGDTNDAIGVTTATWEAAAWLPSGFERGTWLMLTFRFSDEIQFARRITKMLNRDGEKNIR